jgi:hypothetical protein
MVISLAAVGTYVLLVGVASFLERPVGRSFDALQLNALIRIGSANLGVAALLATHGSGCLPHHRSWPVSTSGYWPEPAPSASLAGHGGERADQFGTRGGVRSGHGLWNMLDESWRDDLVCCSQIPAIEDLVEEAVHEFDVVLDGMLAILHGIAYSHADCSWGAWRTLCSRSGARHSE